jgi:hypothetical protein
LVRAIHFDRAVIGREEVASVPLPPINDVEVAEICEGQYSSRFCHAAAPAGAGSFSVVSTDPAQAGWSTDAHATHCRRSGRLMPVPKPANRSDVAVGIRAANPIHRK